MSSASATTHVEQLRRDLYARVAETQSDVETVWCGHHMRGRVEQLRRCDLINDEEQAALYSEIERSVQARKLVLFGKRRLAGAAT